MKKLDKPMGGRGKAHSSSAKKFNRNKKGRDIKNKSHDDESDLSDIEAEYLEEVPESIAMSIHKLATENDRETHKVRLIHDSEFLEEDPLISGTLKSVVGFIPEDSVPKSTAQIEKLSQRIFKGDDDDNEVLLKMKKVYTEIGVYLSKYKSGGLPKAFKVLPRLKNWEEVLDMTSPQNWTPNAVYEATHLFASNMTEAMVESYYNKILLPIIRRDIQGSRKLNYHLYMALKKAIFKPMAWFQGILVPLVENGCTYREAAIVGNALRRISIPVLHASAFILRICQCQKWFGSSSFILSILLQKKFNLPKEVVRGCVNYFCKFESFEDQLPVIWHQSLLTLVMNYKHVFNDEDRSAVQTLIRAHNHAQISPVISHELMYMTTDVDM
ncbi:bystin [Babesia gibsoni]|uniref:Bystin n=1 Tax=Babesia gibsoni TaxID=33632 RepID=A0AAD8LJT6_BABGI|nr:bystin [Babesia gibsoni]